MRNLGQFDEFASDLPTEAKLKYVILNEVILNTYNDIYKNLIDQKGMMSITLGKMLERVASLFPDRNAITYTDRDYKRTWAEFDKEVDVIAKAFLNIGIKKGDHVAIWATNVQQWLLTLFASAKIGAVLVTVNTNYKVFEVEYLLNQSDTKALVLIDGVKGVNYVDIINELCPTLKDSKPGELCNPRLPFLKQIIYVGDQKTPDGMYNWNQLYDMEYDEVAYRTLSDSLDPHDVVNIQYTSGTTGYPKGVMLTHYNIINNGKAIGDCMKFTEQDKLCITVPFFHCFGLVLAVMASLTHGTSMVPIKSYHPIRVLDALQSEKCTAFHGVPTMYIAMLEQPTFKDYKLNLRTGIMAGSPCPIKVMKQVVEEMGMREITITYGQTEASPACTMTKTTDSLELRVATVGQAMPNVETKIVDPETGKEQPVGVPGEFCARGYNIMRGYYKMEEATRQAIDADGWLHSGDLATVDENGYYKITGRIKDMIIRGGENIYPKEIEEFLYTVEGIRDVQVIGVPSKQYGEEVCACVILQEGCNYTEQDIKDIVASHMARHKVPSYVLFMDSFFMTASGKIQKFKLRDYAVDLLQLHEAASIETA